MRNLVIALLLGGFISSSAQADTLVIYFSWSGKTEQLAEQIAKSTGADLFQLEPADAYPSSYQACTEVAKEELEKEIYRKVKNDLPDLTPYDTIFIGVPVWWHTVPIFVQGVLKDHAEGFSGKTVIPFDHEQFFGLCVMSFLECIKGHVKGIGLVARDHQ